MKKIKKNQIIITALAIMIAVAGYINYTGSLGDIISIKNKNEDVPVTSESLEEPGTIVLTAGDNVTGEEQTTGENKENSDTVSVNGDVTSEKPVVATSVISEAKLNREQVRAKNKEMLLNIINSTELNEAAKADAVAQITEITENSQKETAAELLLEAKGLGNSVVSIQNGEVDVVINSTGISDTQRAQIEDIIKRKTGVSADKITINVCNN